MFRPLTAVVAASLITGIATAGDTPCSASSVDEMNIVETAVQAGSFKTLAAALEAADLIDALQGDGPFTVFAPTDDAFAKLPEGTVETLLKPENRQLLTAILTYHVVPGSVEAADVVTLTDAETLNGQRVAISLDEGVRVDDANVIATDVACSNGVIHVIDAVIMPSTSSLLETAAGAGAFKTLAAAIEAAGLTHTLAGGPFTVFAPTDDAFAKLPEGTIETLLMPENKDDLVAVLTYHVVPGRVYAGQALTSGTAATVQGSRVRFSLDRGMFRVNGARVLDADIEADNGVIHVIDSVILPG